MDKLIKFSTSIIAIGPTEFIIEKGNIIKVIELLLLVLMEVMLSFFLITNTSSSSVNVGKMLVTPKSAILW